MRDDPSITRKGIMEKTGVAIRTVDRIISELRQRKAIDRQGSDKKGKWLIL